MVNNDLWHTELGKLKLTDLDQPDFRGLRKALLEDTRLPLDKRGLQCGGICRELGFVEWMYIYERGGQIIAAHQRSSSEERHQANEGPEHQAYKERTLRVATEAGHRAETEVRTPDGKVRSDVLVYGATATPTAFEIQRSHLRADVIRRRDKAARDHGISATWHTDDTRMFNRNEVAWTRTDNDLPPQRIRDGAHLQIRGGVRHLEMEKCDERRAKPCLTKRTGKCGKWHPVSRPHPIDYDDFVRGVAAGSIVQAGIREFRTTFHFWTPARELEQYEDSTGKSARSLGKHHQPEASRTSDREPTCHERPRDRPRIEMTSRPILDWRDRSHWSETPQPCRYCQRLSHLLDNQRRPAHKVCAEEHLNPPATTAAPSWP